MYGTLVLVSMEDPDLEMVPMECVPSSILCVCIPFGTDNGSTSSIGSVGYVSARAWWTVGQTVGVRAEGERGGRLAYNQAYSLCCVYACVVTDIQARNKQWPRSVKTCIHGRCPRPQRNELKQTKRRGFARPFPRRPSRRRTRTC